MKKLLFATTALVAFGAPATASDIPARAVVKAPVMVTAPVATWTGCYVGAHIGGGWGRTVFSNTSPFVIPPGADVSVHPNGFLGGAQIGCDYQFAPNWVIGIANDFSWADIKGNEDDPFFTNKNLAAKTEWIDTLAGRLGYAGATWMVYGLGGVAWASDRYDLTINPGATVLSAKETRSGWVAGSGLEWRFAHNWSAKIEYNYLDFGTKTVTLTSGGGGQLPIDVSQRISLVKVGINYRF